ncbi:hydrogenase maturation nickel metallochaperone HypA [Klebsiella sp. BIGb0407]|uniref:hydrogenase maturation nickel metallochaperone HypA n=1 Tax=Klebsiella sp. BIGb0407 TaxID=2940603 RepID=UPI0021679370|nr:hydrogenase maturation nickel metallochaperone HypA [Klebsiella sp. BIGb0407]MCS3433489.1 hydrogenase nickel incorporation protein HypA/HybF [Klebsiella sp. BIGb0407]
MHEITLCQNAVEIMQQFGRQNNARKITAVWMEIGAFSCVEPEAVQFCFELACRETLAEGCELHLETPQAESWCYHCQQEITLLSPSVLLCPICGGRDVRVVADDGMKIKRIEIE